MSIDPQLIRSEEYRDIGLLIQRDAGILIERWSHRAVQEEPDAQRVHHEALLNHLPNFLQALGHTLAESAPEEHGRHRQVAASHGEQRWETGWSLTEVVRDYQILRLVIVDYLEENLDRPVSAREAMAVGLALDEAIAASVARYVKHREEHVVRVEQERTTRERLAKEALQKWEQIFQAAGWGVALINPRDNTLEAVNPAFAHMHGYPVDELLGEPLTNLFAPETRAQLAAEIQSGGARGQHTYEALHLRKDGSTFPVLTDLITFTDDTGAVLARAANFQDITQRKKLEEELRAQAQALKDTDRRKDEFLATLAHELRNPLAPILNSVQVLQMVGATDPTVARVKDILERQTRHLARLVDDLLDLSRVARGQVHLRRERLNLAAVVQQALQTSEPLVKSRQHQLSIVLPEEAVWLEGDQARLVQVLVNVLNNAAKYTDPGGHIWLSGAREDDHVALRVRDTGVGLAPEMLPRIFDLFVQVEPGRERSQGGLGIGLALVRKLVELHGGSIGAHSAGLGKGSEFTIRLPALPAEVPLPGEAVAVALVTHARHVLIVEDNADGRQTLEALLKLLGHRVEVAGDGPRGLEMALASPPDVALIDLGLPGLDGYEVARRIRAALVDRVFLVALTGFGRDEDRQRSQEAGFHAHLLKPVDLEQLTRLLEQIPPWTGDNLPA